MARELRLAGVREIRGGLVADTSLFGGPAQPAGWPTAGCDRPYCAPFDALMANFSSVEIRVAAGSRPGDPVRVGLFPLDCGLQVDSQARTTGGGRSELEISLVQGGETGRVVVRGTLGAAHDEVHTYRRVPQAVPYALGCLRDALQREGVAVAGKLRSGTVPGDARLLARHRSRPLHALVADMNRYSNNVMAESLIKLLSAGDGTPGTTMAGLQRLQDHLGQRGVDTDGWLLADGSGLSRAGRVTALGIAGVLQSALQDPSLAPEMIASLAVGGGVGTLSERLLTSGRRVRAKTGTISGALSLAGYAYPEGEGLPLIFAFLINGPAADQPAARQALDRAAMRLLAVNPSR
jgi:D-alanyl-D-alanine carboxypeptidase/D-alanyl-D-alanine-endopeptidase (penicillin-binding protein 4)